jgi:hypothetical protein
VAEKCCRDDCDEPVGRNGVACHAHWSMCPDFLARSWYVARRVDDFHSRWLREQVRHVVRGEPFTA